MKDRDASKYKDELIFALDIGTRSVVGVLGAVIDDKYTVLDYEQRFHSIRAMRDGQIEDIDLVSRVCNEIKMELENRHNIKLTRVAIAAAGRALKTVRATHELKLQEDEEITSDIIQNLDYSAIAKAQDTFYDEVTQTSGIEFQCVGYSVIEYKLDDYPIRKLDGHKGLKAEVEIIAAFLPFSVVKSLYAVTARCDLEVFSLTLEPIAAINVIVPPDVRLLNIAIADIGAGTSDIAISRNGSIIAYDMATTAGDEITESIMSTFLTDFDTAETLKKSLFGEPEENLEFQDILGFEYSFKRREMLSRIEEAITALADAISDSVMKCNGEAPAAMFLIGGGSQIPNLCEKVASNLGMPNNRVALGGTQKLKHIEVRCEELMSPEFVTPLGIGSVASRYKGSDFFSITVNDQKIMLMHTGTIKVLDALLLAGIKATCLIGHSSRGITYFINGQRRHVRGTMATAGQVVLNGRVVSLEEEVRQGDIIQVEEAEDGKDPVIRVGDIPEIKEFDGFSVNIAVNDQLVTGDYLIRHMDKINVVPSDSGLPIMPGYEAAFERMAAEAAVKAASEATAKLAEEQERMRQMQESEDYFDEDYESNDDELYDWQVKELEEMHEHHSEHAGIQDINAENPENEPIQFSEHAVREAVQYEAVREEQTAASESADAEMQDTHENSNAGVHNINTESSVNEPIQITELAGMEAVRFETMQEERTAESLNAGMQTLKENRAADGQNININAGSAVNQPIQFAKHAVREAVQYEAVQEEQVLRAEGANAGIQENGSAGVQDVNTESEEPKQAFKLHVVEPVNSGGGKQTEPSENKIRETGANQSAPETKARAQAAEIQEQNKTKLDKSQQSGSDMQDKKTQNPSAGRKAGGKITITLNDNPLVVEQQNSEPIRFMDLLKYTQIDEEEPGISLILKLNGQNASYIDPVRNNDVAEIRWER